MSELMFVAFKGKSVISKTIRWFTRSMDYSHIAVMLPDGKLVEAWNHAGGFKQWVDYSAIEIHTPKTHYEVWSLEVPEGVHDFCLNYYNHHAQAKTPYDYKGIIGFISKGKKHENKNKLFCSELAISPVAHGLGWDRITPAHIDPETFIDIIQAAGGRLVKEGVV